MGSLLKPCTLRSGHQQVVICGDRKQSVAVHTLVLLTFVGPPSDGQECLHWDGVPANNRLTNLRWGTREDNLRDLIRQSGGYPRSSLTIAQAREIRALFASGCSRKQLCEKYGRSRSVIEPLIAGRTYKEIA